MLKNIQIKIVLILVTIGIILITLLSCIYIQNLQQIGNEIINNNIENSEEVINIITNKINQVKIISIYSIIFFSSISLIVGLLLSESVVNPIMKIIKNAEKVVAGENVEIKYLAAGKNNTEVDELTNAFCMMTKELKEKLKEVSRQKTQIETILTHMSDGILAFNMQQEQILVNPAAKQMLNLTGEEKKFNQIFKDSEINMEKIMYLEEWTTKEKKVTIGDRDMNILFASLKDENAMPSGVLAVIQDITEHVKLDNMRKEFIADISHELKTPLTSIMGYAETLVDSEYDQETKIKFLNVIISEANRMSKLVNDLLTLSKDDNNKVKIKKTEFDLGELVKKCQNNLQIQIDKKKHKVESYVTANVPLVYADKDGIERVILNILSNSIKYTPEEGTIKIYVGYVYNDAYIKVIDDGLGIPKEDLNRIFERFYRVDKARTRKMGGTGLGLSIAKEILDKNQGSIDIKSENGKGTEVIIKIPIAIKK